MDTTINERLKLVFDELQERRLIYSQADFARQIGKAKATINQMLLGSAAVTRKTIDTICDKFPMINRVWLLTGTGEMLTDKDEKCQKPSITLENIGNVHMENSHNTGTPNANMTAELAALRAENKSLKEQIEWLRSMLQK